jgi:hypothetical protein
MALLDERRQTVLPASVILNDEIESETTHHYLSAIINLHTVSDEEDQSKDYSRFFCCYQ